MALTTAEAVFVEAAEDIFGILGAAAYYRKKTGITEVSLTVIDSTEVSIQQGLIESRVPQTQKVFSLQYSQLTAIGAPQYADTIRIGTSRYQIDNPKLFDDVIEVRVVAVPC